MHFISTRCQKSLTQVATYESIDSEYENGCSAARLAAFQSGEPHAWNDVEVLGDLGAACIDAIIRLRVIDLNRFRSTGDNQRIVADDRAWNLMGIRTDRCLPDSDPTIANLTDGPWVWPGNCTHEVVYAFS